MTDIELSLKQFAFSASRAGSNPEFVYIPMSDYILLCSARNVKHDKHTSLKIVHVDGPHAEYWYSIVSPILPAS